MKDLLEASDLPSCGGSLRSRGWQGHRDTPPLKVSGKDLFQASHRSDRSIDWVSITPIFTWCSPCMHLCVQISSS